MDYKIINFSGKKDSRGLLVALESNRNIPFKIKRVYYLTKLSPKHPRGFHAHKNLKQVAVCVKGSCKFTLDDGAKREEVILNNPETGLYLNEMIWREMSEFSDECTIMVLASEHYDEADYIRNYDDFLKVVKHA